MREPTAAVGDLLGPPPAQTGADATVTAVADREPVPEPVPRARDQRIGWAEALVAVAAFAAMCAAVLTRAPRLLEPDDYAYRASIVALAHGWVVLSNADYQKLLSQLRPRGAVGVIAQWVRLPGGGWISEKNPGYPFLAVPFQAMGILRVAPLFYGASGCLGLFFGGRRWLGSWGGTWAVILLCSSGAALVFAWRPTMPTFTDASLVAAGYGAVLWAMLAVERKPRRRIVIGLLGFVALEAATAVRYTDVVLLAVAAVAAVAVTVATRRAALPGRALAWWLGSVAVFAAGVLAFDQVVYGAALRTGYHSGEISFNLASVGPNLEHMPARLVASMPMLVLALVAVVWIALRAVRSRRQGFDPERRAVCRRDAVVGAVLTACWVGIWGLYATYAWTADQPAGGNAAVHVIRFYLPAIGLVAPLGAWVLVQLPRWAPILVVAVLIGLGAHSYPALATPGGPAGPGGGPGGPGGPGSPGGGPGIPGGGPGGPGGPGGGPGGTGGPGIQGRAPGGIGPDGAPPSGGVLDPSPAPPGVGP